MAQSPMGKVVPLGDHPRAKARLSKKEPADMLVGCRELALDRMARALSGMLDRVEDDLFDLAEKAPDREAQNAYLDARAQARDKRVAIEATFGQHFVQFFDRKVRGEPALEAPQPDSAELSLVGDEALEETIAVREMSRKLDASCEGELIALSQRMGFLLEKPDLADDANPFSPATICAALKDACDQIEAGFKVRMTLLHQFEQYVEADLQRIYHDLNSHLVERSILPDVRPGVRRVVMPPSAPKRPKAAKGASANTGQSGNRDLASAADSDILAALAQLLGTSGPENASGAGRAPASWPLSAGSAQGAASVPQSFVTELTRKHRETGPEHIGGD